MSGTPPQTLLAWDADVGQVALSTFSGTALEVLAAWDGFPAALDAASGNLLAAFKRPVRRGLTTFETRDWVAGQKVVFGVLGVHCQWVHSLARCIPGSALQPAFSNTPMPSATGAFFLRRAWRLASYTRCKMCCERLIGESSTHITRACFVSCLGRS